METEPPPSPHPHPTIQALREGGEDGVVEGLALRAAPSPSGVPGWVGVGSGYKRLATLVGKWENGQEGTGREGKGRE